MDWENDLQEEVRWPAEQKSLSDDPPSTAPPPPLGFQWATFDEQSGTLSVSIDPAKKLPQVWSIWIPGQEAAVFDTTRDMLALANGALVIALGDVGRAHRITAVTIRWLDELNAQQEARLPTLVDDEEELLPPEGLRSLQSDDIVKCLLSGKKRGDKNHDLLKTLDTDAYAIYRTRRLGRAFAALSQRIIATLRTQTAMRHRLERDPVGPLMLARAIAAEGKEATGAGRAATLFALVELTLTLAYVALRVDPKGKLGLRPLFNDVRRSIDELAQTYDYKPQGPDPLKRYVKSVRARCESASKEGLNAG